MDRVKAVAGGDRHSAAIDMVVEPGLMLLAAMGGIVC
jgi:hypothetical protein